MVTSHGGKPDLVHNEVIIAGVSNNALLVSFDLLPMTDQWLDWILLSNWSTLETLMHEHILLLSLYHYDEFSLLMVTVVS